MRLIAQYNLCKLKHIRVINNTVYFTGSIHFSEHILDVLEWSGAGAGAGGGGAEVGGRREKIEESKTGVRR